MIYLILAIILSATIPNLFKLAHIKECRQPPIITFNYLMCVIIVIGNLIVSKSYNLIIKSNLSEGEIKSLIVALVIGIVCGCFYYLGFYFYQKSVRASGAALSSAFGKMGIIIPVLLSAIIWREYPTTLAIIGICLALFAIFYTYFDFKSFNFKQIHSVLLIFFLFGGLGDFSNKLFQKYCLEEHNMIFLFFIFITALLLSLKDMRKAKKPKKEEVFIGMSLGIPNMLTAVFLIKALFVLPAFIVFPMFSGATIIITMLMSAVFYKDIPSKKQFGAILLMIVALVLLNI